MKRLSKRHYIGGLIFVLTLNVALVIFLLTAAFAQVPAESRTVNNTPVTVEVAKQPDSPLLVSFIGVDATNERFQKIHLTIESLSGRPIRGFVLATTDGRNGGKTSTNFFPAKPLLQGVDKDDVIVIEGENIKPDLKVTIFIDYVLFTDTSVWGGDERKMSDSMSGMLNGAAFAANEFDSIVKSGGVASLDSLITKPLTDIEVVLRPNSENQSEAWRNGFGSGYKGFISFIKIGRGEPRFLTELDSLRQSLGREKRVK